MSGEASAADRADGAVEAVRIDENVALAPLTTLGVGGAARWFCDAADEGALLDAVRWAAERRAPWFILGGGSNVVFADEGFSGLVIRVGLGGIDVHRTGTLAHVTAGAGESWDDFVAYCVARGLAGIECLSGIPGRVGATPIQNVGAYGQEVAEVIERVRVLDTSDGEIYVLEPDDCAFAYRDSRFKSAEPGRFVVLAVTYRLRVGGEPVIRYAELARAVADAHPSLQHVRETVIAVRRRKSMVLDPNDPNSRSCGSFFVNPVVSLEEYERLKRVHDDIPGFPAGEGKKLSAAWLIERAGFGKGYARGPVGLSENHALALINRGGASCADVLALVGDIRAAVRQRFGLTLTPEPVFSAP